MSILGSIFGKIFNRDKDDDKASDQGKPAPSGDKSLGQAAGGKTAAAPVRLDEADVEAIMTKKADASAEKLNWRSSIVDLMKMLDIDSSLDNRKALADELGYTGDKSDSAAMNVWLHKQVMRKLAENGGKVPADLVD